MTNADTSTPLSTTLKLTARGGGGFLRGIMARQRVRQTVLLYSSEIGLIMLTFGTGILNSRFLGASQYGIYTFVITVVEAIMLFAGFGYPTAGARVVALAKSEDDERDVQGALVVIALVMGLAMSGVLAVASPVIENVFGTKQRGCLFIASLLCSTAPLQVMLAQACRGANRVGILAALNILPKALYLLGGLGIIVLGRLTANSALALYYCGTLAACGLALCVLRIRLGNVRRHTKEITAEVRRFGFKTYLGGLADTSTYKLNNLLIAGYVDTTWLGFYSIASTMVSPMVRFSTSLSSSAFRSLAHKDRIDKRLILANGAFLAASGIFVAVCARPLIAVVLTREFLPAAGLAYVLIGTAFFQGMYQPLNAFLCAHGKGRELRTISFFVCAVNLLISLSLIPRYGAYGAAIGSCSAKLCELLGNIYYYRKITRHCAAGSARI
jgi:O-antigen/teichoic acid export membrane protein